MALDERDYHSYNLPDETKERNLTELRRRFELSMRQKEEPFIEFELPETKTGWLAFYATFCALLGFVLWYVS